MAHKIEKKIRNIDWNESRKRIELLRQQQIKKSQEEQEKQKLRDALRVVNDKDSYIKRKQLFIECQSSATKLLEKLYENKDKGDFYIWDHEFDMRQKCMEYYRERLEGLPYDVIDKFDDDDQDYNPHLDDDDYDIVKGKLDGNTNGTKLKFIFY